jgi:O-antigen ligase
MAGMEYFSWAILATVLFERIYNKRGFLKKADLPLVIALGGLVLAVFVSLIATPAEKGFVWQMGFMRWTVLLFFMCWALEDCWDDLFNERMVKVWMIAAVVSGLYGAFQCLTGIDFIRPTKQVVFAQGGGIYKAVGFFSFSLTYAYSIGLSVFGVFLAAFNRSRWWGFAVSAAGALGLIASMSRGAWLAALVTVFLFLAVKKRKLVVPAVAVCVALFFILINSSEAFRWKFNSLLAGGGDNSTNIRFHLWRAYWHMWLDHPLFGVGIFDGDRLLPGYFAKFAIPETFTSHAHNNFLNWLAGTGVFGFAFYTAVVGIFLKKAWALRKRTEWGWPLLLAQVFFHLGGMTECNFIDGELTHFVVFIWAMILALETRKVAFRS